MNKMSALVNSNDKIEKLLTLLFNEEPLIYFIVSYIYYFGFSQDEIICYISKNSTYPTKNKQGLDLRLMDYPKLYGLCSIINFNLCKVSRAALYNKLQQYSSLCSLDNISAISLRKTWAYNELCKGADYSTIKHQLSYKGSISQFFEYLDITYEDIATNENLIKLYNNRGTYN